ncbi:MAG: ABC transporter ATP-binding protein [Burkholderiaceae bacterium]|nr:MAG: ABC transporter ATP-binding protein [Burkholderiaceae bacterium]
MAEIKLEKIQKSFGDFTAVRSSSFTINDGEFFVLLGPSGCGKTTTLRMIAGLELPTSGTMLLDGEDVTFKRASQRDIGFVFQMFALYPHMKVWENIGFPLKCEGLAKAEIRQRVEEVAKLLRIEHLLDLGVGGLAGGDSQRVALGRAIVRRTAKAFMMDEPLGALDTEFRHLMCTELRGLHDRIKATTVYVTHDQVEAMAMADRIAVMNHGVVDQIGTPQEIYDRPLTVHVAAFIGSPAMNFLRFKGTVEAGQTSVRMNGSAEVAVPKLHEGVRDGELSLGVRSEHITLTSEGGVRGEVYGAEYMGTTQIVTINTHHGQVKARIPSDVKVTTGESVGLNFQNERLVMFDMTSGKALRSDLYEGVKHV